MSLIKESLNIQLSDGNYKTIDMCLYDFEFNNKTIIKLQSENYGTNWPVVYIIKGDKMVYVGETSDISIRLNQHLHDTDRSDMNIIYIIVDYEANKSSILDIEQNLIRLFSSEVGFVIQNKNMGQSPAHNYYQRKDYLSRIETIWSMLIKAKVAQTNYHTLVNTQLFKYSPYTSLTASQNEVLIQTMHCINNALTNNKKTIIIINGGPGTGKTLLATELMLTLSNITNNDNELLFDVGEISLDDLETISSLSNYCNHTTSNSIKSGLVIPTQSLYKTLRDIFNKISGLNKNQIITPFNVVCNSIKDKTVYKPQKVINPYDVLIVDESHRLVTDKNRTYRNHDNYTKRNIQLGLDDDSSQLDWIIKCSKCTILLYDKDQSVKNTDISYEQFMNSINSTDGAIVTQLLLKEQMRCLGGNDYINYLKQILSATATKKQSMSTNFEFLLFNDVDQMFDNIKELNNIWGLCRVVAGYSWKWKTKNNSKLNDLNYSVYSIKQDQRDITIGRGYVWNRNEKEYVVRDSSIDEIGCVHTVQGCDLNYVGVILGPEIDYDPHSKAIVINPQNYFDPGIIHKLTDEEMKKRIINSYLVLLTRGIRGCYIYACNKNLHDYLQHFINKK